MTQNDLRRAWLPPGRALVVQLSSETALDMTSMAGRVEHVIAGQAEHFHSLPTLLAFFIRVLLECEKAGATAVTPA
jgi:hypothetical protein